jgi:hypothetical protein
MDVPVSQLVIKCSSNEIYVVRERLRNVGVLAWRALPLVLCFAAAAGASAFFGVWLWAFLNNNVQF